MRDAKVIQGKPPVQRRELSDRNKTRRPPEPVAPAPVSLVPRVLQVLVMAVLLTVIAAPTLLPKFSVVDNDIWLHLRLGDWIVQNSAFPHTGILSRTTGDRPWAAYSWFYELLLSVFHSRFQLMGMAIYGLLLTLALTYSIFWMTRRLSGTFWKACILSTLTCAAFLFRVFPRPVFFSMTLFTLTLTLLLEARRTRRLQPLYWLPPIFVLWANTHIQFIYGIFMVGLFVGISVLQEWGPLREYLQDFALPPSLPLRGLLAIFGACLLATCIGPYTYHLYAVVFDYAKSSFPYTHVAEFQALNFRGYTDYVLLLMTGFAFFTLGRQKKLDPFLLLLLCAASIIGFRSQRDAWFVCIPAAACIALAWASSQRQPGETWLERAGLAVSVVLFIFLYSGALGVNRDNLRLAVAERYPVQAVNFLREHPQPGPLYNTYNWGDFLTWALPDYPVAIDGRTDLYGDELDNLFTTTEDGGPGWQNNPYLRESALIVIPKQKALAKLLSTSPQLEVAYQDDLAVVYVRRPDAATK